MKKFLALGLLATVTLAYADDSKMSPDLRASKAQHAQVYSSVQSAAKWWFARRAWRITGLGRLHNKSNPVA